MQKNGEQVRIEGAGVEGRQNAHPVILREAFSRPGVRAMQLRDWAAAREHFAPLLTQYGENYRDATYLLRQTFFI